MGSDFLQRTKRTINAARDRDRMRLAQVTLFTRHPECARYAGRARLRTGVTLAKGEQLLVQYCDGQLLATRGLDVVADFHDQAAGMLDAVECAGGIIGGEVVTVMDMINCVEIILCP